MMQFEVRVVRKGYFAGVHNGIDVFTKEPEKAATVGNADVERLSEAYGPRSLILLLADRTNGAE